MQTGLIFTLQTLWLPPHAHSYTVGQQPPTDTMAAVESESLGTVATERSDCVDAFPKLAHCLPALVDICGRMEEVECLARLQCPTQPPVVVVTHLDTCPAAWRTP